MSRLNSLGMNLRRRCLPIKLLKLRNDGRFVLFRRRSNAVRRAGLDGVRLSNLSGLENLRLLKNRCTLAELARSDRVDPVRSRCIRRLVVNRHHNLVYLFNKSLSLLLRSLDNARMHLRCRRSVAVARLLPLTPLCTWLPYLFTATVPGQRLSRQGRTAIPSIRNDVTRRRRNNHIAHKRL